MKQFEYFDLHQSAEGIEYYGKLWSAKYKNAIQNLLGALGWELICVSSIATEGFKEEAFQSASCDEDMTFPPTVIYTYKREQTDDFIKISAEESDILNHINQKKQKEHLEDKLHSLYKTFEDWAKRKGFSPNTQMCSGRIDEWVKRSKHTISTFSILGSKRSTELLFEQHIRLTYYPDGIRLSISYFEDKKDVHAIIKEFTVNQIEMLRGLELKSSEEVNQYEV